jgi:hypothetical protein
MPARGSNANPFILLAQSETRPNLSNQWGFKAASICPATKRHLVVGFEFKQIDCERGSPLFAHKTKLNSA